MAGCAENSTGARVSVAVFAYNEERTITAALQRIDDCGKEADLTVHVLINGCTDGTEAAVRAFRPRDIRMVPVVIPIGDKAHAWNQYTHHLAPPDAAVHVYTDGDMQVSRGSIAAFLRRFAEVPHANGCAGLPVTGRSRDSFRAKLVGQHEMAGNLYAIRASCLAEFRRRRIRLPFGVFGEDGLVTTLIKYDLDLRGRQDDARITAAEAAGFGYRALSPWRLQDWRIYHHRRMRYAMRRLQARMLYALLKEQGTAAMPVHVVDLYRARGDTLDIGWNGLDTPFDWIALRRIRRDILADDSVKQEDRAHLYS